MCASSPEQARTTLVFGRLLRGSQGPSSRGHLDERAALHARVSLDASPSLVLVISRRVVNASVGVSKREPLLQELGARQVLLDAGTSALGRGGFQVSVGRVASSRHAASSGHGDGYKRDSFQVSQHFLVCLL